MIHRMRIDESFVAIDFETADQGRDSACAVGLVRVDRGKIVDRAYHLIRPPRREFEFTYIHGITWEMVENSPNFAALWPRLTPWLADAPYLAAHNAGFDRSVLAACCGLYGLPVPEIRFECSMQLARQALGIYPTKLGDVCGKLGIPLDHHYALSDAEACALIVLEARKHTATSLSKPTNLEAAGRFKRRNH